MKVLLILNPASRDGRGKKLGLKAVKIIEKLNINYDLVYSKSLEDITKLSREGNSKYETIVIMGGDGSINHSINGFYDEEGRRISDTKLGIIYTGTSPDFCKSYKIPLNLKKAINLIKEGKSEKISIGKIKLAKKIDSKYFEKGVDNSDLFFTRFFACCVNIGLGASVARNANSGIRKKIGDFLGTFISLFKSFFEYKATDFKVLVDDKQVVLKKLYNLSIGKTFYIASGIKVKNTLKENDKNFYLLKVSNIKLLKIPSLLKTIYSGREIKNSELINFSYCNKIEILAREDNLELEFDGDPMGFLPCKIEETLEKLDLIKLF